MTDYSTITIAILGTVGVVFARVALVSAMCVRRVGEINSRNLADLRAAKSSAELQVIVAANDQRYAELNNVNELGLALNPMLWTYRQFFPEVLYHE